VKRPLGMALVLLPALRALAGEPGEIMSYDDYSKPPGSASSSSSPSTSSSLPPAPAAASGNDFRYKVLFKIDLNYELDDAGVSDAAYAKSLAFQRGGQPNGVDGQAGALNARADYLSSDHVLGTEGLGWQHLRLYYNGFLLHRFEDNGGAPSAAFPTAYLTGRQQTAYDVRAGYGEINGFKDQGFWSKVYLRAGRQWRYGAGVATFDGVTLGYQSDVAEVSVWGGRRSPRFLDNADPGLVYGVTGKLHLEPLTKVPIDLGLDYLMYAAPEAGSYGLHHLLLVDGVWRIKTGGRLLVSVSSYDFSGLRAHVSLTHPVTRNAQVKVYYDVKLGRDLTYDYISGFGFPTSRFFVMPDVNPRSLIGLRWDHMVGKAFEYALFANFNVVHGSDTVDNAHGLTGPTAFDATYEELGAIARVNVGDIFQPEGEYRVRLVQRAQESGLFSDSSQSGEHQFQELRLDLRFRAARGFSMLFGAIYRLYDYVTRYAPLGASTTVANDSTVAGTASFDLWIKRLFQIRLRYEVGQDSTVFAPELGVVQSLFATVGGRF
jgi:hypothetical protein